jgi:hypothetical protein
MALVGSWLQTCLDKIFSIFKGPRSPKVRPTSRNITAQRKVQIYRGGDLKYLIIVTAEFHSHDKFIKKMLYYFFWVIPRRLNFVPTLRNIPSFPSS